MAYLPDLPVKNIYQDIPNYILDMDKLEHYLESLPLPATGPAIVDFQPWHGYAGTEIIIIGRGFSEDRRRNQVEVGGKPALIVEARANRLTVITHNQTRTGTVKVAVDGASAVGPRHFEILPCIQPASDHEEAPFSYG